MPCWSAASRMRLVRAAGDGLAVQRERDRLGIERLLMHYSTSFGKVLQHRQHRIGRRLTEAADRRVHHRLRQLLHQRLRPTAALFIRSQRLHRADAARRALAARLVGEELHHVARRAGRRVLVREHDDRGRADEAAVLR